MLKKENRLSTKFEFNITRKYGKKISGRCFHLFYLQPKNYKGPTKIGFVISNKFDKRAVVRNKVKRKFREIFRKSLEIFPQDLWVVVHPKFICIDKSYEEISADINSVLSKIFVPRKL